MFSSLTPHVLLRDYPDHLTKYEDRGTLEIPIFKLFSELEKIWTGSLGFSKIQIFHLFYELRKTWKYINLTTHFESMDQLVTYALL